MINRIIAVYPGRFQPMGRHHKATYDWMVSNFGPENSFIVNTAFLLKLIFSGILKFVFSLIFSRSCKRTFIDGSVYLRFCKLEKIL